MSDLIPKLLMGLMVVAATGCAASQHSADQTQQEVLSTDDARIRARTSGDVPTLATIYADDYTLVTADGVVRTKDDQINEMRSGQLQFQPVETIERTVRVYGETAIVMSREHSSIIRNGQQIGGDMRVDRVYVRRDGRWQLVLTQATRVAAI